MRVRGNSVHLQIRPYGGVTVKELDLQIKNRRRAGDISVKIDGETVTPKPDNTGDMEYKLKTDKDTVKLEIVRVMDAGGALWFIVRLFFFIITVFGLFDLHHKENFLIADFSAEIDLKESSKFVLRFDHPKDGQRAAAWETDLTVRELSNTYHTDAAAKKKYKILNIAKLFTAIAVVAVVATVLIVTLV